LKCYGNNAVRQSVKNRSEDEVWIRLPDRPPSWWKGLATYSQEPHPPLFYGSRSSAPPILNTDRRLCGQVRQAIFQVLSKYFSGKNGSAPWKNWPVHL